MTVAGPGTAPAGTAPRIVLYSATEKTGENRLGQFANIVFEPDDNDATYAQSTSRGVEFTEASNGEPWGGRQANSTDQDGNTFVMVKR